MPKDIARVLKATKVGEGVFRNERIWRLLSGLWTVIFIPFVITDFMLQGQYKFLVAPMSAIYLGVLGLYVGTKEFDRWYEKHTGRHPGEWFVIIWTLIIFGLLGASFFLKDGYRVSSETVAVYIMVLTVFALTQKSKSLYRKKRKK